MNQYNPYPVAFANNKPNTITFAVSSREQMVEAFRISKDGIRANPDIPTDEAAHAVMSALNTQIKQLVQQAVEDERARACRIVTGLCLSDNNAREINEAIKGKE